LQTDGARLFLAVATKTISQNQGLASNDRFTALAAKAAAGACVEKTCPGEFT
jgi:hypothetical protein